MIRLTKRLALLLIGIVLLRTAAIWITQSSSYFIQVVEKDFDPSIMFYTESTEVLKAEKVIDSSVNGTKPPS